MVVSFTMLIGLPASGKTTIAKKLAGDLPKEVIVLSSDEMRKKLFGDEKNQDRNSELFEKMNKRAINYLKNGTSVIYDALNLSSKKRKHLLKQIPKGVTKFAIYINRGVDVCIENDKLRNRQVGEDVIKMKYKQVQIPMFHEGWKFIQLHPAHHPLANDKKEFVFPNTYEDYVGFLIENGCEDCIDFAQDTPYHTLSVSRHMYYAYENAKNIENEDIKIALLLHDIGKPYCKEFKGKYASFKCHEHISTQKAIEILRKYAISEKRVIKIATIIELHMRLNQKDWSLKSQEKFKNEIGVELWEELVLFNKCDSTGK